MAGLNPAVVDFLQSVNRDFPGRKKASDGTWGDRAHQKRKSDHNTGDAVDITHDPKSGADGNTIAARALRDPRVKYVIWNHQINSKDGRGWRPYKGANPHTQHVHVSFKRGAGCANCKPIAQGDPNPKKTAAKPAKKKKKKRKTGIAAKPMKQPRSKGGAAGGSKKKGGGKKIVQGEPTVVMGGNQLMMAHVQTPHTGGGKIAKGSGTVFIGRMLLAMARIGDPTTDNYKVKTGHDSILNHVG